MQRIARLLWIEPQWCNLNNLCQVSQRCDAVRSHREKERKVLRMPSLVLYSISYFSLSISLWILVLRERLKETCLNERVKAGESERK